MMAGTVRAMTVALLVAASSASALEVVLEGYRFDPLVSLPEIPDELRLSEPGGDGPALAIVQFDGPITPERRAALESRADVLEYLPEFAYLVRTRVPLDGIRQAIQGIRWAGPYHPAYRLSSRIGAESYIRAARAEAPFYTLRVEVLDRPLSVVDQVRALGGDLLDLATRGRGHRLVVNLPKGRETALARHPDVTWIEEVPDYRIWNNTTRWVVQSNQSGVTPIWDQGLHGEGQIVTVMDTGLDYASCWFRDAGNPPPGPGHRKVIDYTTWGGQAYDGCSTGHGTHVAGTVAGDQSFINPGNYDFNGMAYAAKITLQDVGDDGFFDCLFGLLDVPASLLAPFQAAHDLGARVHTNSWGSTSNSYDGYARDVDDFMWGHPTFLICFAAGNSGPGGSTVGSPGTAKNLVTVGATRQAPQQNTVATYSSRGPASDGRLKPTLMAPGGEDPTFITSANNTTDQSPSCNTASSPFQGTSMATPAVAGLALLCRQYFVEGWYPLGAAGSGTPLEPPAALVKALLVNASADMGAADIPNNNEGWGRALLDDALYFDGDARELRIEAHDGLSTGESVVYAYGVEAGEPLEITLVWTDYPAATGGGVKLVNDLDLEVTGPGGSYRGNVFAGGESTTGGSADRRNVEEVVRLNAPAAGAYEIRVAGFNVPSGGAQPFGLVSTGAFSAWPPGTIGIEPAWADAEGLRLLAGQPNPFNPRTLVRFEVDGEAPRAVSIAVYDGTGRLVRRLFEGTADPGRHEVVWEGEDTRSQPVASGTYLVRLEAGRTVLTRKLTLIK